VALHDGSVWWLKNLEKEFNPTSGKLLWCSRKRSANNWYQG